MSTVTNWRGTATTLRGYDLPQPGALVIDRRHEYQAPPSVRVEALTATWCMDGKPVVPGRVYAVSPDVADSLVHRGKARRA